MNLLQSSSSVADVSTTVTKLYEGTLNRRPSMEALIKANLMDRAIYLMSTVVKQVAIITQDTEEAKKFKKNFCVRILQDLMKVIVSRYFCRKVRTVRLIGIQVTEIFVKATKKSIKSIMIDVNLFLSMFINQ